MCINLSGEYKLMNINTNICIQICYVNLLADIHIMCMQTQLKLI